MNKTKIEWTDYTWNPVTGCWGPGGTAEKPNRCFYCYAQKVANRFPRNFNRWHDDPFVPRFAMGSQLMFGNFDDPARVKKPSKIFVCSMGDLFGDWVPEHWISEVRRVVRTCPQHIFQFLTKNPRRLSVWNPWPSNCWVGTTVTNQADADERYPWLLKVDAPVRFVSHEPLMGHIDVSKSLPYETGKGPWPDAEVDEVEGVDWAIIGAMTGPGAVPPKGEWVQSLVEQYRDAGVPIFIKDNLYREPLGWGKKIQEWPGT